MDQAEDQRAWPPAGAVPAWFWDAMILIIAVVAAAVAYSNALSGDFVLDDSLQITSNALLVEGRYFWRALTSDIWAFRGSAGEVSSHYWRPALVVWWMLNYRIFGLHASGWHATSILLHAAVLVAAWAVLRRLALPRPLAAAAVLIFAVHPVHVESVAWISGSSDMLYTFGILSSIWFLLAALERPAATRWAAAVACYVVAMTSKETAIVYPALCMLAGWVTAGAARDWRSRAQCAASVAAPFTAVACIYLAARVLVLGTIGVGGNPQVSLGSVMLTAPSALAFYLRQTFLPFWIGPSYPLRSVTRGNIGADNFAMPVLVLAAAAIVFWWLARRDRLRLIGGATWLLFLLPALNFRAFEGERLVHDRYLYLPLLGALMVAVPAAAAGLRSLPRLAGPARDTAWAAAVAMVAMALGLKTYRYNNAWSSELALAEAFVRADPGSVMNHTLRGTALHQAGLFDEAIAAFDRALEIHPWYYASLFRARSLIEAGRFEEAERALVDLVAHNRRNDEAYELLADCYVRHGRLDQAEEVLREARREHPQLKCLFTSGLVLVLQQLKRPGEALAELESVRRDIDAEYSAAARMVLYQLGSLYEQSGRQSEARDALRDFLARSEGFSDPAIQEARRQAQWTLGRPPR